MMIKTKKMHYGANVSADGIAAALVTCSTDFPADPW